MNILRNGYLLSVLLVLFTGLTFAEPDVGASNTGIALTNASMVAPAPEKENLNLEWVEISNQGTEAVDLAGWTLSDQQSHTYTFENFILSPGTSVKVHTGFGDDCATDLYCSRNMPIWNNDGDVAVLRDQSGNIVAAYPEDSSAE